MNLNKLFSSGYFLHSFSLDAALMSLVELEKWDEVDLYFKKLTSSDGELFLFLQQFHSFNQIETMLSVRDSKNDWEEDGIWHDDGSRVLALSLSLTLKPHELLGGTLELRKKNEQNCISISTPDFGTGIVFLTGVHGYEHRTRKVLKGKRVILVAWCS